MRKSMWEAELDVVIGHRLVTDRAWDFIDGGKLNLKDRSFLERALIRERRTEIATQRAGSQEDNRTNG